MVAKLLSLPRYRFQKGFCLSFNPKHFSNTNESIKFLKEIITPYAVTRRELLKCQVDQKALVIMDVFTGQMTAEVLNAYEEANILIINVPDDAVTDDKADSEWVEAEF